MCILVPMFFALIQSWKDQRDKCSSILTDQIDNPIIVPEVQCPLSNLPPTKQHKPIPPKIIHEYLNSSRDKLKQVVKVI